MNRKSKIFLSIVLAHFLFFGMMLIDYGITFKCLCSDVKFYAQTLLFEKIEARVVYHLGIILILFSFLVLEALYINEVVKNV